MNQSILHFRIDSEWREEIEKLGHTKCDDIGRSWLLVDILQVNSYFSLLRAMKSRKKERMFTLFEKLKAFQRRKSTWKWGEKFASKRAVRASINRLYFPKLKHTYKYMYRWWYLYIKQKPFALQLYSNTIHYETYWIDSNTKKTHTHNSIWFALWKNA